MKHISPWFYHRIVTNYYRDPIRHYHNSEHIKYMFDTALALKWKLTVEEELAILFHDAVYIPGGKHNEAMSAALMRVCVGETASDPQKFDCFMFELKDKDELKAILDGAEQIILDTVTHLPRNPLSYRVVDLDLHGLATDRFDSVSELIWLENRSLFLVETLGKEKAARKLFNKARSAWAKTFLSRTRVFYSKGTAELEPVARANLERLANA